MIYTLLFGMTQLHNEETKFIYFLDDEGKNRVLVRIILSNDGIQLESFAIIQFSLIGEKNHQIVRFDATLRESIHMHQGYLKGAPKKWIEKPVNWETLFELEKEIRQNWQLFLAKYKEKKGL